MLIANIAQNAIAAAAVVAITSQQMSHSDVLLLAD